MAAQTLTSSPEPKTIASRTVVVIDRDLPKGLAANAAAVLAITLGVRRPDLVGPDFDDAAGTTHLGLFPTGLPILGATAGEIPALCKAAREKDLLVVDFPAPGHQTTDYDEFRAACAAETDLAYLAVLISGPPRIVRAMTGQLGLLR